MITENISFKINIIRGMNIGNTLHCVDKVYVSCPNISYLEGFLKWQVSVLHHQVLSWKIEAIYFHKLINAGFSENCNHLSILYWKFLVSLVVRYHLNSAAMVSENINICPWGRGLMIPLETNILYMVSEA